MSPTTSAIPLERLMDQLPENYTLADRELIQRAYRVAEEAHREQKRHSGEPYINHCLAVAIILADLRVPPEVVAAGLLHDTVEDTTVTLQDLPRDFGGAIAVLVDGVTKLTNLPRVSRDDQHAESPNGSDPSDVSGNGHNGNNGSTALGRKQDLVSETLRKTFLAMGEDVRVVLIKLADRLHNMRTLGAMPSSTNASGSQRRRSTSSRRLPTAWASGRSSGSWRTWASATFNPEKYKEIAD